MFGACKVCLEKDKRLEDLQRTLDLVIKYTSPVNTSNRPSIVSIEADKVMSGSDEITTINESDGKEISDDDIEEANRILMGTY